MGPSALQTKGNATSCESLRCARNSNLDGDRSRVLAALVGGLNPGFRAYLSELVVDAGIRHQGIGTHLVLAVEEALRDRGQRILIGDVWHDAESFYRSLGWEAPEAILLRHRLEWHGAGKGTDSV